MKKYFATQGLLPGTAFGYWRMIWETESSATVMVLKLQNYQLTITSPKFFSLSGECETCYNIRAGFFIPCSC